MGAPVGPAEAFVFAVAQRRYEGGEIAADVAALDELVEVGLDPMVLPPDEQDDGARRAAR